MSRTHARLLTGVAVLSAVLITCSSDAQPPEAGSHDCSPPATESQAAEPTSSGGVGEIGATVAELLELCPCPPRDLGFFLPDLYPEGPPLEAAVARDSDRTEQCVRDLLVERIRRREPALVERAVALFDSGDLVDQVPDPRLRSAAVLLLGTIGEPALDAILDEGTSVLFSPALDPDAAAWRIPGIPQIVFVNVLLVNEDPGLIAALFTLIVHEVLHHDEATGREEEVALLFLEALVHLEMLRACLRAPPHRSLLLSARPDSNRRTLPAPPTAPAPPKTTVSRSTSPRNPDRRWIRG